MSKTISHEALLPVALELFKSVGYTKIDTFETIGPREKKLETLGDDFAKFYSHLRTRLQVNEE